MMPRSRRLFAHAPRRALFLLALAAAACGVAPAVPDGPPGPPSPAADPIPWVTPAVQGVNVEQVRFRSAAADAEVSFHLYLPDAYASEPDRRFPVLYWLHGGGNPTAGIAPLASIFHRAIARGDIPPLIVVFPNGLPLGMWVNALDGRQPVETVLMDELIPLVDRDFRTLARAESRLLDGFSMGGYGAGRLGFLHPERFAAISMLGSGPLQLDFLSEGARTSPRQRAELFRRVYGASQDYFEAVSPWRLAEALAEQTPPGPGIPLRILVGSDDELLAMNRRFHEHLTALGIPHDYQEVPGVPHALPPLVERMGDRFWAFYRDILDP